MGRDGRPWRIDAGIARDLTDAVGWQPAHGPGALAALLPTAVPMGSTAKLAAIADGEVPPGAEVGDLARQVLDHAAAVAASRPAPSPSWSCWVAATVMAALVDAADLGPVDVAAVRRTDPAAPMVDFHAAVVVATGQGAWICDPYFGTAVPRPAPGERLEATGPLGSMTAERGAGSDWTYDLRMHIWDAALRFRCFGPALDAGDVRAMAAISVTHTGVPLRPYARLHVGDGIVDASEAADGTGVLHGWTPGAARREQVVPSWAEAVEVFAERTGTRIT